MRIVLSGGGTGGHLTPILSTAAALRRLEPGAELFYLGQSDELADSLLKDSGFKLYLIKAGKWRRYTSSGWLAKAQSFFANLLLNLRDLARFIVGFGQSLRYLWQIKPDVVFVKGGYVGLPVGLAAWVLARPLVIHESDIRPGVTNRILGHLAKSIAVSWPVEYFPKWQHKALTFTGVPIRSALNELDALAAKRQLGLTAAKPVLLVTGGSQGARAVNQIVLDHLEALLHSHQILHLTGTADFKRVMSVFNRHKKGLKSLAADYHAEAFLTDAMAAAYAAAEVVVSRAGMSSLAEAAVAGKPLVIIPHPALSDQPQNAAVFEKFQAAVVLNQDQAGERLVDTLAEIERSDELRRLLKKGLAKLAKPHAATELAKVILGVK